MGIIAGLSAELLQALSKLTHRKNNTYAQVRRMPGISERLESPPLCLLVSSTKITINLDEDLLAVIQFSEGPVTD